jgi:hypothetical protein
LIYQFNGEKLIELGANTISNSPNHKKYYSKDAKVLKAKDLLMPFFICTTTIVASN